MIIVYTHTPVIPKTAQWAQRRDKLLANTYNTSVVGAYWYEDDCLATPRPLRHRVFVCVYMCQVTWLMSIMNIGKLFSHMVNIIFNTIIIVIAIYDYYVSHYYV